MVPREELKLELDNVAHSLGEMILSLQRPVMPSRTVIRATLSAVVQHVLAAQLAAAQIEAPRTENGLPAPETGA